MSWLLAILDLVGFLGFMMASVYAFQNHEAVKFASKIWWHFANAAIIGAAWSFVVLMEELGISILGDSEPALFFAVVFLFTIFSTTSFFNFMKPLQSK